MEHDKILIIAAAWIGDMVMAQSLLKLLKQRRPKAVIDILAPIWTVDVLARMSEVNEIITLPISHGEFKLTLRYQIARQLKEKHYTQAILLPNSWKSALIPFLANIPRRTGWRGEMRFGLLNDLRYLDKKKFPLMVERFVALGLDKKEAMPENYPYPELVVKQEKLPELMNRLGLTTNKPILALAPGAEFGPAKRWPSEHYATLATHYLNKDWQVWLFGSPKEKEIAKEIQVLTNNGCYDLIGETSLGESIDLLSLAHTVVSNDSGLMHIASALKKPQIAIYGSTTPSFTPPLNTASVIVSLNVECSPCFQRQCPLPDAENLKCLNELKPNLVIDKLEQLHHSLDFFQNRVFCVEDKAHGLREAQCTSEYMSIRAKRATQYSSKRRQF